MKKSLQKLSAKQKSAMFLMKGRELIFPIGNYLNSVNLVANTVDTLNFTRELKNIGVGK